MMVWEASNQHRAIHHGTISFGSEIFGLVNKIVAMQVKKKTYINGNPNISEK